jgi:hypothetical protein
VNAWVRWLRNGLGSTRDADLDEVMGDRTAFGKAEAAAAHGLIGPSLTRFTCCCLHVVIE